VERRLDVVDVVFDVLEPTIELARPYRSARVRDAFAEVGDPFENGIGLGARHFSSRV
jgi:hypothetical protein